MNWTALSHSLAMPTIGFANIRVLYAILAVILLLTSVITFNTEVDAELESFRAVDGFHWNSPSTVKGVVATTKVLMLISPLAIALFGLCLSQLVSKASNLDTQMCFPLYCAVK